LAHKAEHAIDLDTGAVVAVTVQDANRGDTSTFPDTLVEAVEQLDQVTAPDGGPVALRDDIVTDKGAHSRAVRRDLHQAGFRTYLSEPARPPHRWHRQHAARDAVYANHRRLRSRRGRALLRRRGELLERTFAPAYETGGPRRTYLRSHANILKRILVHLSAFNLGLLMRRLIGVGTPHGLQGRTAVCGVWLVTLGRVITDTVTAATTVLR
jgi:transposase